MSHRICDACNKQMQEGYVINGGEEYYCSEPCLNTKYTTEYFEEMYNGGDGDCYWTEWYDEDEEFDNFCNKDIEF